MVAVLRLRETNISLDAPGENSCHAQHRKLEIAPSSRNTATAFANTVEKKVRYAAAQIQKESATTGDWSVNSVGLAISCDH